MRILTGSRVKHPPVGVGMQPVAIVVQQDSAETLTIDLQSLVCCTVVPPTLLSGPRPYLLILICSSGVLAKIELLNH